MSAQKPPRRGILGALLGLVSFSAIAGLLVAVMVAPAIAVTGVAASSGISIFENLPSYLEVGEQPQQNKIYAIGTRGNGETFDKQIATVYSQNREEIAWEDVLANPFLKNGALAAEDKRFYSHGGIDVQGVVRAAAINFGGSDFQGGSTLTQQLVKNICISNTVVKYPNEDQYAQMQAEIGANCQAPSIERKLQEMKYAIGLEKQLTKDEILLAYLNIAGFGGNVYGIQSAAQRYFGVDATELTLAQTASLLGIVQDPERRRLDDPANYEANQVRRDYILRGMLESGWIDQAAFDEAIAVPVNDRTINVTEPRVGCTAAYKFAKQFCDYVVRSVPELESLGATPEEREDNWRIGGYSVYTSLDLQLNKVAQQAVQDYAPKDETLFDLGASAISVEPGSGFIRTMAQNKTFDATEGAASNSGKTAINFNTDYAHGGSRGFQPGSGWKMFTLINWLEHGHGLEEIVNVTPQQTPFSEFTDSCNGPYSGDVYAPKNDSGETGYRTVRQATAQSINGAFVQMILQLDLCDTAKIALSLGAHRAAEIVNPDNGQVMGVDELFTGPSSILGVDNIAPLSMAGAIAAIANHGIYCTPRAVTRIVTVHGEELAGQAENCTQQIPQDVAAAAASGMSTGAATYNGNPRDGTPLIGKTGTTDSSNQTWVNMSSTALATTVWFGNITGSYPIRSYSSGGTYAGDQRHQIMRRVMALGDQKYPGAPFDEAPSQLLTGVNVAVGDYTGLTEEQARSSVQSIKLSFANGGVVPSALPAGQVAKQTPEAGTQLSLGQEVRVWLSDGSRLAVPDVLSTRQDYTAASSALYSSGFTNVTQVCVATTLQYGVLDPATGQYIDPGSGLPTDQSLPEDGQVVSVDPGVGRGVKSGRLITLGIAHATC
jgi:membrane peptidoglycan carboxypeptidase